MTADFEQDQGVAAARGRPPRRSPATVPWSRFALLGDSMTRGSGRRGRHRAVEWGDMLVTQLRRGQADLAYLNLGRPGATSSRVRAAQIPAALEFSPDLVAIACGLDDAARSSFEVEMVEGELVRMVMAFHRVDCQLVVVSPPHLGVADRIVPKTRKALHARLRALAEATGSVCQRFGAVHVNLTNHPAAADRSAYQEVGGQVCRLSDRGHALVAAETARLLGRRIGLPAADTPR